MPSSPLQQFLRLKLLQAQKTLLTNPLRTGRRLIWLLWSFICHHFVHRRKKQKRDGDSRRDHRARPKDYGVVKTDRNREKSRESSRSWSNAHLELKPVPPPSIGNTICASEIPSSLHPSPYNHPKAAISSQELQPSTSTTFDNVFSTIEDQVSILGLDFTSERETIRVVNEGPSQGYYVSGPITTSPIEVSAPAALDGHGDRPDTQTKNLSDVYSDFFPMAPEIFYRYYNEGFIEPLVTFYELAPMTTRFQDKRLPLGWKEFLHPEGPRYFLFEPKRIYTEADIYNPKILRHAKRLINEFDEYTRTRNLTLSSQMNLTLDMFYEEEDDTCPSRYYIADHASRTVFWLDRFDADQMHVWSVVKGVTEITHIRHAIEAQYWYHCLLFPDSYKLEIDAVDELRDILTYWIGDVMTSMSSTIPYNMGELQQMLSLVNELRINERNWGGVAAFESSFIHRDIQHAKDSWIFMVNQLFVSTKTDLFTDHPITRTLGRGYLIVYP
ncbi:hypothetical protein PM082_015172 [Marasmius tenuissimus]|nr:hypothetical protein PM082_015172 [Marasmius tenuissimus]